MSIDTESVSHAVLMTILPKAESLVVGTNEVGNSTGISGKKLFWFLPWITIKSYDLSVNQDRPIG